MDFLLWILFGGIVGWVASMIMKTDGQQGIFLNIIVGVIGAVIGGWVMGLVGQGGLNAGFSISGFLVALLGACLLIWVVKLIRR